MSALEQQPLSGISTPTSHTLSASSNPISPSDPTLATSPEHIQALERLHYPVPSDDAVVFTKQCYLAIIAATAEHYWTIEHARMQASDFTGAKETEEFLTVLAAERFYQSYKWGVRTPGNWEDYLRMREWGGVLSCGQDIQGVVQEYLKVRGWA